MRSRRLLSSVALCTVATLAACGGDSKGVTQPAPLSPADFTSMTDALANIIGRSSGGAPTIASPNIARSETGDMHFTVDAQCPVGGTISLVGIVSASSTSTTSTSHFTVTADFRNCAARGGNGEVWTFGTKPSIALVLDVTRTAESTLASGSETGTITWSNGTRNGSCTIDVTSSTLYTTSNKSYDILVNGTVCGTQVDKHTVVQAS
jgi:predicted small lipoprotein YifL